MDENMMATYAVEAGEIKVGDFVRPFPLSEEEWIKEEVVFKKVALIEDWANGKIDSHTVYMVGEDSSCIFSGDSHTEVELQVAV